MKFILLLLFLNVSEATSYTQTHYIKYKTSSNNLIQILLKISQILVIDIIIDIINIL